MPSIDERIDAIFKHNLKKKSISPEQREAVKSVAEGRDTLVIMPTGGGKSSVYQAAALLVEGKTLAVSPLQVTVQEQLESIQGKDLPPAKEARRGGRISGNTGFILASPGELERGAALEKIIEAQPTLVVVDEAHCISEKGHDFKQHYLRLRSLIEQLGNPTVLALTATASPPVRREIQARLAMKDARLVKQSLERKNLWMGVLRFDNDRERREELVRRVATEQMPGFVYVADHRRAEAVCRDLVRAGVKADLIHEQLPKEQQQERRKAFEGGEFDVLVATAHFSMGISNDEVNFVYHCDISDSVESYYQESGRAGRDDQDSRAVLFYIPSDLDRQPTFTSGPQLSERDVDKAVRALERFNDPVSPERVADRARLGLRKTETVLRRLWDLGGVEITASGEVLLRKGAEISAPRVVAAQERRRMYDLSRSEMMRGYAETRDCRRVYILDYFGETGYPQCGNCDNCQAGTVTRRDDDRAPIKSGSRVVHETWGAGLTLRQENDKILVLFDEVGYQFIDPSDLLIDNPAT
jgi:ATP-dependent DNA helicase RecQ